MNNTYVYIFIAAAVTFLVRVLPLTLIRKPIKSRFIRSFLFYVPYATLAVMTFPSIVHATQYPLAGALALIVGILLAWKNKGLFNVAISCCVTVFVTELILKAVM